MLRVLFGFFLLIAAAAGAADGAQPSLASAPVRIGGSQGVYVADGVVEAVRQSAIAAQVQGAITLLSVKPGDAVRAGQLLARIDARAANQTAAASSAQVAAARAELEVASREYERQKQLFEQDYISQGALDRAEAQFKSARARANALLEQAGAAQTQSGFYTLTAPYSGVVAEVPATQGDMATPGRTLITVYDPREQRVTANVPQAMLANLVAGSTVTIEIPGLPAARRMQIATRVTVLPVADPATHTVQIRLELPPMLSGLAPGMFARALLPVNAGSGERLYVPAKAVFRRAEVTAVYVLDGHGKPQLRQIKPGPAAGEDIEVLSGVAAGERIALDPLAAAKEI